MSKKKKAGDEVVLICPEDFNSDTAEYWERLVASLKKLDLLDESDAFLLELTAKTWEEYDLAQRELIDTGTFIEAVSDRGNPITKSNPASAVANQAGGRLRQCLNDLGLGPLARKRMNNQKTNEDSDPLGNLLDG